uniref:Uncharacterized protein n=1 Tax=Panagrolaimus sp. JU765 TaxID=591449 RepID=A0AC34Q115_9BILA
MAFKLIDQTSPASVTSALNIFNTRPTNVSVINSSYHELLPLNPVTMPPYQFKIAPSEHWLDLSKTYLSTTFSISKKSENNWVEITDKDDIAPIQALGTTFVKNLRVSVNQREIFNANALYAYKTMMDLELSTTDEVKNSYLQSCGYYKKKEDRKSLFVKEKKVEFLTRILADIFTQPLYFMNHTEIDIELSPNDAAFCLIGDKNTEFKLEIQSIKLFVKAVNLLDNIAIDIDRKLQANVAKYAVSRTELKSQFITEGRYEFISNLQLIH